MSSFWEKTGGHSWRLRHEPPRPPEDPDGPEEAEEAEEAVPEGGAYGRASPLRYLEALRSLIFARLYRLALQRRRQKRRGRPGLVSLRSAIQRRALQVLAPGKDAQAGTENVYARARLERAELTESYAYEQEISLNPSKNISKTSKGSLKLTIPYDGYKYFTRQARADIEQAIGGTNSKRTAEAVIGYLLLANYGNTDLDAVLELSNRYGAVPIRVPVATDPGASSLEHLTSDRQTCVIDYEYEPSSQQLRLHPIDVQMKLLDPDSLGTLPPNLLGEEGRTKIDDIVTRMTQQVNFRPYLWLCMIVSLHLPRPSSGIKLTPKVTKMALHWPTITSLDALRLTVDDNDVPLKYNPETGSVEWSDISMAPADDTDHDGDIWLYQTSEIILAIKQPGELYQEQNLDGQVEVEVPGYLMSGLEARLFSATGGLSRTVKPTLVCNLSSQVKLILDDAFAKREFSPWQQLYFDEIILEEARITDIVTALQDRKFEVMSQTLPGDRNDRFLVAKRREGPDHMVLWLLIERQRYQTERASKVPGGHTYKSLFESGELRVFIRGTLPRDSRELTHEMNALQQTLRERFDRVRARR